MFKCAHCVYKTRQVDVLVHHVKESHEETNAPDSVFQCKVCSFTSNNISSVAEHAYAKHKKVNAYNTVDDLAMWKYTVSTVVIKQGMGMLSSSNGLSGSIDEEIIPTQYFLEAQFPNTDVSNEEYKSLCFVYEEPVNNSVSQGKTCSSTSGKFSNRISQSAGELISVFQCKLCFFTANDNLTLTEHMAAKHTNCKVTSKAKNASNSKDNTSSSSKTAGERTLAFKCKFCSYVTATYLKLMEHRFDEHKDSYGPRFIQAENNPKDPFEALPKGTLNVGDLKRVTTDDYLSLTEHTTSKHKTWKARGQPKIASKKKNKKNKETCGPCSEPKPKDPFKAFPKGTLNLDEFKRIYSNNDTNISVPYFWSHFDPENYSIWLGNYKYSHELKKVFMSCNLINGMFQRLDTMRKNTFASVCLYGKDDDSTISGIWVWPGKRLAFELNPDWRFDYDSYNWTKLNSAKSDHKKIVNDLLKWTAIVKCGRAFNQGFIFK